MRTTLAALALLCISPITLAQPVKTPEQLLSADCLVYFRYDGYEPHKKAYEQTALAKAMKEGLGEFFDHAFERIFSVGGDLAGGNPKKGQGGPRPEVDGFLDFLSKHGFVLGVEVAPPGIALPRTEDLFQITLVFPNGAEKKNRDALDRFFRFAANAAEMDVEEIKHGGRTVQVVKHGDVDVQAAWWTEGKHMMCGLGVLPFQRSLPVIEGRRSNLTAAKWHKDFAVFNRFETDMRGYVNLAGIVDRLAMIGLEEPGLDNLKARFERHLLLAHLGVTGLKDLTFHLGFDGKYQRSTVRLGVVEPEKRGGLLRLATTGPIAYGLDKLPPLPPDADLVKICHVDWQEIHDFIRTSYGLHGLSNLIKNGDLPPRFPDLDRVIGGDFRKDFLEQLDTTVVTYGAHSEGPFFLGQGFAIKVKDAAKVRKGLEAIAKELGAVGESAADKRMFRGAEMVVFSKIYLPITYTIHNDWLVFGLFPQPVQGYLLRSGGKYKVWKKPPEAEVAIAKELKENSRAKLLGVSVSDPRPAIEIGLALLPAFIQTINKSTGMTFLDVSKIPNAQSVNEWVFPNITLCYDDGNAIRWEHHYSINEPDDLFLAMLSPSALSFASFIPFSLPTPRDKRPPGAIAPPEVVPPPAKVNDEKQPILCRATAFEKDGMVQIQVTVPRIINETVTKKVAYTANKPVRENGVVKMVAETHFKDVTYNVTRQVSETITLIPDGKSVQVTRKDGKAVDPKELPKLLEKESQVLFVRNGAVDADRLQKLDERTLIIRVAPDPAP